VNQSTCTGAMFAMTAIMVRRDGFEEASRVVWAQFWAQSAEGDSTVAGETLKILSNFVTVRWPRG